MEGGGRVGKRSEVRRSRSGVWDEEWDCGKRRMSGRVGG